jgi:hypothetical protein
MTKLHRILGCFTLVLTITGCSGSSAHTQTLDGTFVTATAHRMQVNLQTPGSLSNYIVLPVDPKAKITVSGKTATLADIPVDAKVHIVRDLDTRRVVRVQAN